jgi:hypothetical protein
MSKKIRPAKTRDYLMKRLIEGATKGGVHKDHKKEQDRLGARGAHEDEEDEVCMQCFFPLRYQNVDGFCSDTCQEYYEEQHGQAPTVSED